MQLNTIWWDAWNYKRSAHFGAETEIASHDGVLAVHLTTDQDIIELIQKNKFKNIKHAM